jgi:hypothetical protein
MAGRRRAGTLDEQALITNVFHPLVSTKTFLEIS